MTEIIINNNRTCYDAIDAYLEQQMRQWSIPGIALAIVEDDRVVHFRGFGKARPGGEVPTPQTPFLIGSITKSITALGVMQLVEAGKVELDAPVQCYLPWFQVADTAADQITVRHLLNQTSGLPMTVGMYTNQVYDDLPGAVERYVRSVMPNLTLASPPGEVFDYCNLNYDLLGLVIEAASGEPYADYVQKHIFDPLEMRHSYTSQAKARENGLAVGHRYWFGVPIPAPRLPVPRGSLPSGLILSCAEDMARYLIAHLNGGRCGDAQVLSEAGMQQLHQGALEYLKFGLNSVRYAMGWFDSGEGKSRVISHGGNNPDFSASIVILPEQKKGLVLLTNCDHFGLPPIMFEVADGAAALLGGKRSKPIKLGFFPLSFVPWMMRLLAFIPLLQFAGAAATLRRARRWRKNPALQPARARMGWQHILLPLIPNLSLAAIPLFFRARGMREYLRNYMPDVYWTSMLSGGFAGLWAILRTVLILRATQKPPF